MPLKNTIVPINKESTFWDYRNNLILTFHKYAFSTKPFLQWVADNNANSGDDKKITADKFWDLLQSKKVNMWKFTFKACQLTKKGILIPPPVLNQNERLKELWPSSGVHTLYWIVQTLCWQEKGLQIFRDFVSSVSDDAFLDLSFLSQHVANSVIFSADQMTNIAERLKVFGNPKGENSAFSPKKNKVRFF